jgi:hypothetical protein
MPRCIPALAATLVSAATLASSASAMPIDPPDEPTQPYAVQTATPARDVAWRAMRHEMTTHNRTLVPDRIDAAAHAATIRGIGAAHAERVHPHSRC